MRNVLACAAVLAVASAAPAAADHPPSIYGTTCGFLAVGSERYTGGVNEYTVTAVGAVAGIDVLDPQNNPISTTVTCSLVKNGATLWTVAGTGTAAVAAMPLTSFVAGYADHVQVCTTATSTATMGRSWTSCDDVTRLYPPEGLVCDAEPRACSFGSFPAMVAVPGPLLG